MLIPFYCSGCSFYIQAEDHGSPPKSSQVLVRIQITDADNNQPVFNRGFYSASLSEERSVGYQVIQVGRTYIPLGKKMVVVFLCLK